MWESHTFIGTDITSLRKFSWMYDNHRFITNNKDIILMMKKEDNIESNFEYKYYHALITSTI